MSCKPLWNLWDLVGVLCKVVVEQAYCSVEDVFGVQGGGEKVGQLFLDLGDEECGSGVDVHYSFIIRSRACSSSQVMVQRWGR